MAMELAQERQPRLLPFPEEKDDGRLEDYGEGMCFRFVVRESSIAAFDAGCWSEVHGRSPASRCFATHSEGAHFDEKSSRRCDMRRVRESREHL